MKICNFDQYSDEWWAIRECRMTASNAQAVGSCGAGLKTYIRKIMQEYYSTGEKEHYSNKHTERGNLLEDSAATVYSFESGVNVGRVGFVTHGKFAGCSPDRFAGDDGLVEIKCPDDKGFFGLLLGDKPESKYVWQCQFQMFVCKRAWCDLVYYNCNFSQNLIVIRMFPDEKMVEKIQKGIATGIKMIKEIKQKMDKDREI